MKPEDFKREIQYMLFPKPQCTYEHVWNQAINEVMLLFEKNE